MTNELEELKAEHAYYKEQYTELKQNHIEHLERSIEVTQSLLKANARIRRMEAEGIEQATMVERLTATVEKYANPLNWQKWPDKEFPHWECVIGFEPARKALRDLKTPPPNYADRVLALARAALKMTTQFGEDGRFDIWMDTFTPLIDADSAITQEDKEWMGLS